MVHEEVFAPEPYSVRAARRFVANKLGGVVTDLDIIQLLVSELATNAVHHARSDFVVRLHLQQEMLRVEVEDKSPVAPTLCHIDPDSTSGRGIQLVAGLSSEWGFELLPDGKRVWFLYEEPSPPQ